MPGITFTFLHFSHLADTLIQSDLQLEIFGEDIKKNWTFVVNEEVILK